MAADQRKLIHAALNKVFGTPRQPRVGDATGEDDATVVQPLLLLKVRDADAKAPFKTLAQGSKVYRYHCVHCHGLTGDGRGPTGPWVVPHPRDYRSGEFKFISTKPEVNSKKPHREDLVRTLAHRHREHVHALFRPPRRPRPGEQGHGNGPRSGGQLRHPPQHPRAVEIARPFAVISGERTKTKMDDKVHELMTQVVSEWSNSNSPGDEGRGMLNS